MSATLGIRSASKLHLMSVLVPSRKDWRSIHLSTWFDKLVLLFWNQIDNLCSFLFIAALIAPVWQSPRFNWLEKGDRWNTAVFYLPRLQCFYLPQLLLHFQVCSDMLGYHLYFTTHHNFFPKETTWAVLFLDNCICTCPSCQLFSHIGGTTQPSAFAGHLCDQCGGYHLIRPCFA